MELDKEKVLRLVQNECRDLGIYYTAVEPIVFVITNLWYTHGHWNWFDLPGRRKYHPFAHGEYKEPTPTILCLYHCLEKIKKYPKQFFVEAPREISDGDDPIGSADTSEQVQTPTISIASIGCDREQGL